MADNITLQPGSGGDTCAADDVGGVKFPRGKITLGADGSNDGDVSDTLPLPVVNRIDTARLRNGATDLTPKFAAITASSSGNTTVVAAVTSKKIRVIQYLVSASAAVNVKFRSATAGDKTGLVYLAASGGCGAAFNPVGHFETASGEALQINLSAAVAVGGHLVYLEI